MEIVGQSGLGTAGAGVAALAAIFSMFVIAAALLLPLAHYAPDIVRLLLDLVLRRNLLEQSERDRELDGRLFQEQSRRD